MPSAHHGQPEGCLGFTRTGLNSDTPIKPEAWWSFISVITTAARPCFSRVAVRCVLNSASQGVTRVTLLPRHSPDERPAPALGSSGSSTLYHGLCVLPVEAPRWCGDHTGINPVPCCYRLQCAPVVTANALLQENSFFSFPPREQIALTDDTAPSLASALRKQTSRGFVLGCGSVRGLSSQRHWLDRSHPSAPADSWAGTGSAVAVPPLVPEGAMLSPLPITGAGALPHRLGGSGVCSPFSFCFLTHSSLGHYCGRGAFSAT